MELPFELKVLVRSFIQPKRNWRNGARFRGWMFRQAICDAEHNWRAQLKIRNHLCKLTPYQDLLTIPDAVEYVDFMHRMAGRTIVDVEGMVMQLTVLQVHNVAWMHPCMGGRLFNEDGLEPDALQPEEPDWPAVLQQYDWVYSWGDMGEMIESFIEEENARHDGWVEQWGLMLFNYF